jgi:hypothetical protein
LATATSSMASSKINAAASEQSARDGGGID